MLRHAMTAAVLGLALAAPTQAGAAKSASVKVAECNAGDAAETRSATFLGRMRTIAGADSMQMRFTLLERFGDERLHAVKTPALRAWRDSKPGVKEFRFRQTVTALHGGGQYRVRVDFRWRDAAGDVVRRARATSSPCKLPGDLPNLRLGEITSQPGPGGTSVYFVPVQNNGKVAARDFAVELFVDGAAANVGQVDSIGPGETREVRFVGPPCQRRVRAVVDPSDSIKERFESDNAVKQSCPSDG
jgi:hypothetical protein